MKYLFLSYKHNDEVPGELSRENMKSLDVEILWFLQTVEPRFNEPIYNEVIGITNDFLQPGQNYNKMYGTEPRFNEILVIKNTIQKRNHKIYFDITNKFEHVIKNESQTDQQG